MTLDTVWIMDSHCWEKCAKKPPIVQRITTIKQKRRVIFELVSRITKELSASIFRDNLELKFILVKFQPRYVVIRTLRVSKLPSLKSALANPIAPIKSE